MLLVTDCGLVTLKLISFHVLWPSLFSWAAVINLHGETPRERQNLFITVTSSQVWIHMSIGQYLCSITNSVKRCIVKKMDGREESNSCETRGSINSTLI
jgi:hypothetical protein